MLSPISAFPQAPPNPHVNPDRLPFAVRLARLRFISLSLVIHTLIILFGGGVVLITTAVDTPDFVAGEGQLVTSPEPAMAAPPEASSSLQETPQFDAASAAPPNPSVAALTAEVVTPTFQMNAAPAAARLASELGRLPDGGKGINQKLAGLAAGGMKGGTARFFGMRSSMQTKGIGLAGTFYDPKQTRSRMPTNMSVTDFGSLISRFVNGGWKETVLNDYYRAPDTLFTTQIFIPNMPANEGPRAFEVEKEVQPSRWLVHYRGRISPPRDGEFRFVGAGDDYLVVRLNGKVVLDHGFAKATDWKPGQYYNYGWTGVPNGFARGDPFQASSSQYYDLEVLISEKPGGLVFFCLMLEDQAVQYSRDAKGNPILPVFRLADGPLPELAKGQTLPPFDPNAPIWKSQAVSATR